jgi:hypothetical protein
LEVFASIISVSSLHLSMMSQVLGNHIANTSPGSTGEIQVCPGKVSANVPGVLDCTFAHLTI